MADWGFHVSTCLFFHAVSSPVLSFVTTGFVLVSCICQPADSPLGRFYDDGQRDRRDRKP